MAVEQLKSKPLSKAADEVQNIYRFVKMIVIAYCNL